MTLETLEAIADPISIEEFIERRRLEIYKEKKAQYFKGVGSKVAGFVEDIKITLSNDKIYGRIIELSDLDENCSYDVCVLHRTRWGDNRNFGTNLRRDGVYKLINNLEALGIRGGIYVSKSKKQERKDLEGKV